MPLPRVIGLGLRANGLYWAMHAREVWIPEIEVLRETVLERAIPAFSGIEDEADQIRIEAWERQSVPPEVDPADLAESVHELGLDHYLSRDKARQALINLFAVALHHLVEQQLLVLLRKELLPRSHENDLKLLERKRVLQALSHQAIEAHEFPEWECMEDLRHLANVVKHAEGGSAKKLARRKPELFTPPILRDDPSGRLFGRVGQIFMPLGGDSVYVTEADLEQFFNCATSFWARLADSMAEVSEAEKRES